MSHILQAKFICTQKKVLVACILVPIISMVSYYYLVTDIGMDASRDYTTCRPKEIILKDGTAQDFRSRIRIWIVVYFFIPAAFIVLLNTTIVIRLAKAQKLQNRMSMRRSLKRSRKLSRTTSTTSAGSNSIKYAYNAAASDINSISYGCSPRSCCVSERLLRWWWWHR